MNNKILAMKITTGEDVLAESFGLNTDLGSIILANIVQINIEPDGLSVKNYFPFSKIDKQYPMSLANIILLETLDDDSAKMYHNSVLQLKIDQVKSKTSKRMTGNTKDDYYVISESFEEIKKMTSEYSEKYGITPPSLADMEEQLEKNKPLFH